MENSRGTLKNREYCESFAQRIFPHLQYSIKSKQTRCIKNSNLRKELGITIKSKETSSQFESVRISYVATRCIKNSNLRKELGITIKSKETSSQFESVRNIYVAIMHQPLTICSTM